MEAVRFSNVAAVGAALVAGIAAGLILNPLVFELEQFFRIGEVSSIYTWPHMFTVLPFSMFWVLTGLILVLAWWLMFDGRTSGTTFAAALLHGAACGSLYVYFLALVFFDPDDFIGSDQKATPWNYSLWTWELYPAFALSGVVCSIVAWLVFTRLTAGNMRNDR